MKLHVLLVALLLGLAVPPAALAQKVNPQEASARIEGWSKELDAREKAIEESRTIESALQKQQDALEELSIKFENFRTSLQPRIDELKSQLETLGPPPEKDAPPEPEGIAEERKKLGDVVGELETAARIAGAQVTHASQLIGRIQSHRRKLFARQLLRRQLSPLSPALWRLVANDAGIGLSQFQNLILTEAGWFGTPVRFGGLLLAIFAVWAGLRWFAARVIAHRRAPPDVEKLDFIDQVGPGVLVALARALPLAVVSVATYAFMVGIDALEPVFDQIARSIVLALVVFAAISALSRTVLAPERPIWRMIPMTDESARRLAWLLPLGAAVHGFTRVWTTVNEVLFAPFSLLIAQTVIAGIIFVILMAAVLLTPLEAPDGDARRSSRLWPKWIKLPLWAATLAIVVALVLGYVALARFLTGQIINTGLIAVLTFLLYSANSAFTKNLQDEERPEGGWLRHRLGLDEPRRRQVAYAVGFTLNLMMALLIAPLLLLQWGFSWTDIEGWLGAVFFGFNIGAVRLSVATVLVAIALFAGGLVITRVLQRWLDTGPLNVARIERGIADSIRTGIGYLGFILSALLAVSYVGFDFTNIAIIAGALSVGIGFGLQSIINNFVSGLILLVERPIKVGDWVIIGDKEGLVRRISVRATEIQTFDRSSMIIPNSELITGTVVNWTHGDSIARVVINVGVSYDADAQRVHDLLLEIGKAHSKTLEIPKVRVVFEDFGASSLDFTLRVYIADVMDQLELRTDLRLAILNRFREEGIEIPFPQRDLHIRSGLPETLAEAQ